MRLAPCLLKKMRTPLFAALLLSLCGSAFFSSKPAAAETTLEQATKKEKASRENTNPSGLNVGPIRLFFSLKAGEKKKDVVHVSNAGEVPFIAKAEVVGMRRDQKNSIHIPLSAVTPDDIAHQILVTPKQIRLEPGASADFQVEVSMNNSLTGTNRAAIAFQADVASIKDIKNRESEYQNQSHVGVNTQLLTLINVDTVGKTDYRLEAKQIRVIPPTDSQLFNFSLEISNSGNGDIPAIISAAVVDEKNQPVLKLKASEEMTFLAGQTKTVTLKPSTKILPQGSYRAIFTIQSPKFESVTWTKDFQI